MPSFDDLGTIDLISNAVFVTGAIVLLAAAVRTAHRGNEPSTDAAR